MLYLHIKGYNITSWPPLLRKIQNKNAEVRYGEETEKEPSYQLKWMPWATPAILSISLSDLSFGTCPRRSFGLVCSM
jgi:hypothetical protein